MDLLRVDLNLLKIFESVYRLRSLTEVAREVSLTQPAVSHALSRLRETFNDRLFVRTATGLEPTPRSDELAEPIRSALSIIEDCLHGVEGFRPDECRREFRLLLSDVGELIFVPRLVQYLRQYAPNVRVTVLQAPRTRYYAMLRDREADLAIGHLPKLGESLKQRQLFVDRWVVLRHANQSEPRTSLTLDDFKIASHVEVDPPGTLSHPVESLFEEHRIVRNIVLRLPHYFSLPSVILSSDLIATVPNSIAENLRNAERIVAYELPFLSPVLDIRMYWHLRLDSDPAHQWLRSIFGQLFTH